jgi:predicted MFS family arabinose efflux permease
MMHIACAKVLAISVTVFGSLMITDEYYTIDNGENTSKTMISLCYLISGILLIPSALAVGVMSDRFQLWKVSFWNSMVCIGSTLLLLFYIDQPVIP